MNRLTTSFDGEEILIQMRTDLDKYRISQYPKQYIIDKKEKLIKDLYSVMCTKSETSYSQIFKTIECELATVLEQDSEIGVAHIIIPLRLNKTETVLFDFTKNLEDYE